MANTTFNGAVRSENGFQVISKAAGTGVETTNLTIDANGSITTNVLGINLKPTLAGQTVTAKATAGQLLMLRESTPMILLVVQRKLLLYLQLLLVQYVFTPKAYNVVVEQAH